MLATIRLPISMPKPAHIDFKVLTSNTCLPCAAVVRQGAGNRGRRHLAGEKTDNAGATAEIASGAPGSGSNGRRCPAALVAVVSASRRSERPAGELCSARVTSRQRNFAIDQNQRQASAPIVPERLSPPVDRQNAIGCCAVPNRSTCKCLAVSPSRYPLPVSPAPDPLPLPRTHRCCNTARVVHPLYFDAPPMIETSHSRQSHPTPIQLGFQSRRS